MENRISILFVVLCEVYGMLSECSIEKELIECWVELVWYCWEILDV